MLWKVSKVRQKSLGMILERINKYVNDWGQMLFYNYKIIWCKGHPQHNHKTERDRNISGAVMIKELALQWIRHKEKRPRRAWQTLVNTAKTKAFAHSHVSAVKPSSHVSLSQMSRNKLLSMFRELQKHPPNRNIPWEEITFKF